MLIRRRIATGSADGERAEHEWPRAEGGDFLRQGLPEERRGVGDHGCQVNGGVGLLTHDADCRKSRLEVFEEGILRSDARACAGEWIDIYFSYSERTFGSFRLVLGPVADGRHVHR